MTKSQQVARAQVCAACVHLALAYLHGQNFIEEDNKDTYIFAEQLLALKKKAKEYIKIVSTYEVGISEKRHAANQIKFLQDYDKQIDHQKDNTKKGLLILNLLECAEDLAFSVKIGSEDFPVIRFHAEELHQQFQSLMSSYIIPTFPELEETGLSLYFDLVERGKGISKKKRKQ